MKKLVSMVLVVTMLSSMIMTLNVAAANDEKEVINDIGIYTEDNGDVVSIEEVVASTRGKSKVFEFRVSRNDVCEENLIVDMEKGKVVHEYADGRVVVEDLADIVTITEAEIPDESVNISSIEAAGDALRAVDYVSNEHFNILPNGDQAILEGGAVYDGYRAMGNRGGYYYAPTTFGYLQRRNDGIKERYYSRQFNFSVGTALSTAAGIIYSWFTNSGIGDLIMSVITNLLGVAYDNSKDWDALFEVRRYEWLYRVRLNSNTGSIIGNYYRTKDFWVCYNRATGIAEFEYRGSGYDDGFMLANTEMIKAAIDSYIEANLK